ncbi:MAG: hypothetical protein U0136_13265 [Bdellovibrionota bacterium]
MGSREKSRLEVLQDIARGFGHSASPTSSFMQLEGLWAALKSYPDNEPLPDRAKWVMLLEKAGHLYGSMVQADVTDRYGGDVAYYTPFITRRLKDCVSSARARPITGTRIAEAN